MSELPLHELKAALLEVLPPIPERITRTKARGWHCRFLGENVTPNRFNAIVEELVREDRIRLGPGQGGTITFAPESSTSSISLDEEACLYLPVKRLIEGELVSEWKIAPDQCIVEVIAGKGRSRGRYLHPDLVLISRRVHRYLGAVRIDVHTFEIKTERGGDATAVLEAMSQRHRSHYGYVVWHLPDPDRYRERQEQVRDYAERFGIGLIIIKRIEGNADDNLRILEHEVLFHAKRHEPEPLQIEALIDNHLSDKGKKILIGWHTGS
jgi:hypothetical protein